MIKLDIDLLAELKTKARAANSGIWFGHGTISNILAGGSAAIFVAALTPEIVLELVGEVNRLREWKNSVLGAVMQIPEWQAEKRWAGGSPEAKRGWGFVFEVIRWQTREIKKLREELRK